MEWPRELEALRAEARAVAEDITALIASNVAADTGDPVSQVVAQRAMLASTEIASPEGTDDEVAGVPCRVFRPSGARRGTYVHFHGGALLYGSPRMNDLDNERLSKALDVEVVSVDYRLAPEHPFPAGADDCVAVATEVLERGDGPVVLGGESAGGYYAALTAIRMRDEAGGPSGVAGVNLTYGLFDLTGTPSARGSRASDVPDILDGKGLRSSVLEHYLPGRSPEEAREPACSPLYADLRDLPPALFTVGTADHLLDDSLFMCARWRAFGNEATLALYPDGMHGFTTFPMELGARANARITGFLDECFGT